MKFTVRFIIACLAGCTLVAVYLTTSRDIGIVEKKLSKTDNIEQNNLVFWTFDERSLMTGNGSRLPLFHMPMLTDGGRAVIDMPWGEVRTLIDECNKIPDSFYRSQGNLPTASIIITFHSGETWYNLIHTLHSIFQRTPSELLHEVILIDDFSNVDDFGYTLEMYVKAVFGQKVKLYRNTVNLGLIRSRLYGIRLSSGDVVIVMDSHSEVQHRWLEPLLFEVKKNRRTYANSQIDWMLKTPEGVWKYRYSGTGWTVYFDWSLVFGWQTLSRELRNKTTMTRPFRTKVNIGAYGAFDRQFFEEIGSYDDGMQLWGGENIDVSIRTWLFGGQVLSVPCSRVAHRETPGSRDYRNNFSDVIKHNYKRIVDVWFDDYSKVFYLYNPSIAAIDAGNLTSRFLVKSRASHNFSWFLSNVFPELGIPGVNSFAWGQVKSIGSGLCLDTNNFNQISTYTCSSSPNQIYMWSNKFEVRRDMKILHFYIQLNLADYMEFYGNDRASKWIHWKDGPLLELTSKRCLESGLVSERIDLKVCNFEKASQRWTFSHYSSDYDNLFSGARLPANQTYEHVQNTLYDFHRMFRKSSFV